MTISGIKITAEELLKGYHDFSNMLETLRSTFTEYAYEVSHFRNIEENIERYENLKKLRDIALTKYKNYYKHRIFYLWIEKQHMELNKKIFITKKENYEQWILRLFNIWLKLPTTTQQDINKFLETIKEQKKRQKMQDEMEAEEEEELKKLDEE